MLWENARAKAKREGIAMRTLILTLVEKWTERPSGYRSAKSD